MNDVKKLATVSQEIYDGYGISDEVGLSYFEKFIPKLSEFDFVSIIRHQMRCYPHRYVLDFILSSSPLWLNLPAAVWLDILYSSNLRVDTSKINDQLAQYADIELLSRYVGVDALKFLIESQKVSLFDKNSALAYFSKFPYGLVPSSLDDEDLDGVYFVKKESLISLRGTLCIDFCFSCIECSDDNANEYIRDLRRRFNFNR
jgi:hypothetical protein